jgi:hypothetical protein
MCEKPYTRIVDKGNEFIPNVCSINCFKEFLFLQPKEMFSYAILKNPHVPEEGRRSNYERAFESFLKDHNIAYQYEAYILRGYVPDYYLPDYYTFVEVKGIWERGAWKKFHDLTVEHSNVVLVNHWFLTKILKKYPRR